MLDVEINVEINQLTSASRNRGIREDLFEIFIWSKSRETTSEITSQRNGGISVRFEIYDGSIWKRAQDLVAAARAGGLNETVGCC